MLKTPHKLPQKVIIEYNNIHVFGLIVGNFTTDVVNSLYYVATYSNKLNLFVYDSFALTSKVFMTIDAIMKPEPFKYTVTIFYCDPILGSLISDLQSSFYPNTIRAQQLSKMMCEKAHEMLDSKNQRTIVE